MLTILGHIRERLGPYVAWEVRFMHTLELRLPHRERTWICNTGHYSHGILVERESVEGRATSGEITRN